MWSNLESISLHHCVANVCVGIHPTVTGDAEAWRMQHAGIIYGDDEWFARRAADVPRGRQEALTFEAVFEFEGSSILMACGRVPVSSIISFIVHFPEIDESSDVAFGFTSNANLQWNHTIYWAGENPAAPERHQQLVIELLGTESRHGEMELLSPAGRISVNGMRLAASFGMDVTRFRIAHL